MRLVGRPLFGQQGNLPPSLRFPPLREGNRAVGLLGVSPLREGNRFVGALVGSPCTQGEP